MTPKNNIWKTQNTDQLKLIIATLEDAKKYGYTNVIIGETGCGKSFVSKKFAEKNDAVFIVTVGQSDNIGDILDKILLQFVNTYSVKTKSKKLRTVIKLFKELADADRKPMLIFDEAEFMKQPALCAMKELYDSLKEICGIIMIGTDQLINNIERMRKRNKEGIPQFYSRIKFGIRFLPGIDKNFKLFIDSIEDKELIAFLKRNCDNYRELHDIMVPAIREAERINEPLSEKLVRTVLNIPNL